MAPRRFILRFRGEGSKPEADVGRIRALAGARVLDDSSRRMVLVEAPEDELRALLEGMPDWILTPERMIPLPDARRKIRRQT